MNLNQLGRVVLLLIFLFPMTTDAAKLKKGEKLRINVSETKLKNLPKSFGAKILKILTRGNEVLFIKSTGSFHYVTFDDLEGYLPAKSVIKAKKFKSFSREAKVTESDMSAATKGFSPEVEKHNRKNKDLRYDLMDKAENFSSVKDSEETLKAFREEGKLGEFQ